MSLGVPEAGESRSVGVNLRVTGHSNQGGRKYMEDYFSVAYQQTHDDNDLEYAYFGIFDGHGGKDAALFAKEHLMDFITKQKCFWSEDDSSVLRAIREGFLHTQRAMWTELYSWKKSPKGHPSTAGTTASVAFIKRGKIFTGHVGDSRILLGQSDPGQPIKWRPKPLTKDHKPDCPSELQRIQKHGGKVVLKSGVPRVVWKRHKSQLSGSRSSTTPHEEVPFLAVARALGDLWSYNAEEDVFIVSPEPDLQTYTIDVLKDKCLILATDGAWNVLDSHLAVQMAHEVEKNNEHYMVDPDSGYKWINPSKHLVDQALYKWNLLKLRSDNITVLTVMLDAPGPPRAQVLRKNLASAPASPPELPPKPKSKEMNPHKNLAIISRVPNSPDSEAKIGTNLAQGPPDARSVSRVVHDSLLHVPRKMFVDLQSGEVSSSSQQQEKSPSPPPIPERNIGHKCSKSPPTVVRRRRRSLGEEENKSRIRSLRGRRVSSSIMAASPLCVLRSKNPPASPPPQRKSGIIIQSASKVALKQRHSTSSSSDKRKRTLTWGAVSVSKFVKK
eukprot:TRINITY_DN1938_c0_g1_i1.p1 TRINITY_DN1938_c0_g1~~TRINITY_DN1938_c0_g1_i1.p1  ORF type:complete len:556 (-),score=169.99 TRINITY_DN1938_c0_g1_i1:278-1945(-)